jgi:hypothetical protein
VWAAAAASILVLVCADRSEAQTACTVTFRLTSAISAASLQFEAAYTRSGTELVGSGSSVACTNLAPALPTFTDTDSTSQGLFSAAYIAPGGFSGPRDLVTCNMTTDHQPSASDFAITVTDATDPSFNTIAPLPNVVVKSFDCNGAFSTTTTSTSTTTSTTLANSGTTDCTLSFSLVTAVQLGSLQWSVDYSAAPGEVGGSGATVQCTNKVPSAFASMQDNEGQSRVNAAYISLAGFTGPRLLAECTFLADDTPDVSDFTITVSDAATKQLQPVTPLPTVTLSNIDCTADTTTTTSTTSTTIPECGNGDIDGDEECDDGPANDNATPGGCRVDCTVDRVCGDGDGNGTVNVIDAQWVLKAGIHLVSPCPLTACDPTGDANVSVSDAQRVLFKSVGLLQNLVCALPITLRVDQAVSLGSVAFDVNYGATGESFLGEGIAVDCTPLVGGATASFSNDCDAEALTIDVAVPGGFVGPVDLAECRFRAVNAKPASSSFSIDVLASTGPSGNPVPPPALDLDY